MSQTNLHFGIPIKLVDPDKDLADTLIAETLAAAQVERANVSKPWTGDIESTFKFNDYVNVVQEHCPNLKKFIYKCVNEFLADIEVSPAYNIINMDESWYNYSKPGMFQEFHIHPESDLSGIFYVTTPENSGNIIFNSPSSAYNYHKMTHRSNIVTPNVSYIPAPARLLLWPSYLEHMVEQNKSNDERISIAFNVKLIN